MKEKTARENVDEAIRQLSIALRDLCDGNYAALTDQDLRLWTEVTAHRAIQDRKQEGEG